MIKKILIIDDNPTIIDTLEAGLEIICPDSKLVKATNGKDANQIIKEEKHKPFDLIICDYDMSPGDGSSVLNYVEKENINSLFVMLTSFDNSTLFKKIINKKLFKYIQKPFNLKDLEKLVKEVNDFLNKKNKEDKLKDMGEAMSSLIHEINNPLGVILCQCELLKMSALANDDNNLPFEEELNSIEKNSEKINKLIKDTRNFLLNKKPKKDKNVKASFNQLYLDLKEFLLTKKIDYDINIDIFKDNNTQVSLDQDALAQIFHNLINNSHDAIYDNKEKWIDISITENDKELKIFFTDSGTIENFKSNDIFKKGFSDKKLAVSSGLGLDICRKILHNNDHDIKLLEDSPNTCFEITFTKENE